MYVFRDVPLCGKETYKSTDLEVLILPGTTSFDSIKLDRPPRIIFQPTCNVYRRLTMSVLPADTVHWSVPWINETGMLDVTQPVFEIDVNTLSDYPSSVKGPDLGIDIHHDAHWTLRRPCAGRIS